jgi:diguanylate cyclase (GGDEF)-like protein
MSEEQLRQEIARLELALSQSAEHADMLSSLLERKLNEIHVLYHVSRSIGSLLDVRELFQQIAGIIKKSIPFDRMSLYLADENRERLDLTFSIGIEAAHAVSLRVGEGLPGRIVEVGEHSHVHDLALFYETFNDFVHVPGEGKRDGSYIGIALKAHNAVLGVIGIDSPVKYGLSVDDMDFMAVLSPQIAAGVEKVRLFGKIQQLSQIDALTGLYNRRVFQEKLQQEMNRRARTQKPLSLILLDIDRFKVFNDTYGHQEGDAVLRELADAVKAQCRHNTIDACCRYGGEEFAVIMPEVGLSTAVKAAERLRGAVERHPFGIRLRHPGTSVTVSVGVAGASGNEELGPEELLKRADEALYRSKKAGRNRVSSAPEGKG